VDNSTKRKSDDSVSPYLDLPIRDLAEVIAEIEACRAEAEVLHAKLARLEERPRRPAKIAVHCRSGFHAR
jgi:cell division septum initiation protein DivIVA